MDPTRACVEAEMLAAWADGALSARDSAAVDAHLATCARCQQIVAAFARTLPEEPVAQAWWQRWQVRWLVPIATVAAVVAIWSVTPRRTEPARAVNQVAAMEKRSESPAADTNVAPPAAAGRGSGSKPTEPIARSAPSPIVVPQLPAPKALTAPLPSAAAPVVMAPPPMPQPIPPPAPPPPPASRPTATAQAAVPVGAAAAPTFRSSVEERVAEAGFIEIVPPNPAVNAAGGAGGAGGGGGRGGGGRGGGRGALVAPPPAPGAVKWRVKTTTGTVERTSDGGVTWQNIDLEAPAFITNGAAASTNVCWLVGRKGLVYRAVNSVRFERIAFPETVDLQSVTGVSAARATVKTVDGRTFTTTDGGITWVQGF